MDHERICRTYRQRAEGSVVTSAAMAEANGLLQPFVPTNVPMEANYTLGRVTSLLTALGNPQDKTRVVHIAGTSGKTSTSYFVRGLLEASGQRTGLTVSPHIESIAERVQVGGAALSDEDLVNLVRRFVALVERTELRPTYFEVLTALAYTAFAELNVDYSVIETGLGGLLDATNTVTRSDKVCVISDIGMDHTEILGTTLPEIAAQKGGIIQPGNHVLLIEQDELVVSTIRRIAEKQGANLQLVTPMARTAPAGLPGFQRRNWALAEAAYDFVADRDGLTPREAIADLRPPMLQPPGRMEHWTFRGRELLLDGAHNPQKVSALLRSLNEDGIDQACILANFIRAPQEKLVDVLRSLQPLASHLIVPEFTGSQDLPKPSFSAQATAALARELGYPSVEAVPVLGDALDCLLAWPEGHLVVTGSLYLVGSVRTMLRERSQGVN
jgi:dihydrofolate synthase/folylpolyglutamate synthase